MAIKDNAYITLQKLGGRATETQLVKEYIKMYPDYDQNYTLTKTPSEAKIRGTINAELMRNSLHEKIKIDKTKTPYEYYIIDFIEQLVVIQPIGTHNSIEDFLKYNNTRWAEKERYRKQWLKSDGAIVLFIKNANIFAMGNITTIEQTDNDEYPLDYSYNLELVDYIDYQKILEIVQPNLGNFRTYQLLDYNISKQVIDYINSQKIYYLDDNSADVELQENIANITSNEPEHKPQQIKSLKENNSGKIYPRNLAYAKKALEEANFSCEVDNAHKTFISKAMNKQYMEAHHLIPLQFQEDFSYSLDIPANIVSVCPNCHRKLHFGFIEDKKEILKKLFERKNNKLKEFGIIINEDELFEIYT
ncbi:HNH endonuclease [Aliarcobacter cryaerophilus]|uniref:HNH endonuclease n=1 Tax=Aliarcobacter cryaerophilus TaxID=28198 RepID=UPI001B5B6C86|nr:HNH endonuclease [Aliarcobacter sp.]MBP9876420.1 HNH endonuclease [Leptotrichiaceae bacterium]